MVEGQKLVLPRKRGRQKEIAEGRGRPNRGKGRK